MTIARLLPKRLRAGDTVGIVSPSWGGAALFPYQCARGVQQLQALGFRTRMGRHALNQRGHVSDSAENRATDIHEFFADPSVRLIVAAIGGDHACHLLPHLDFNLLRENPTAFIGFSDNTVLNVALWSQVGLVTFNGPALLTDFGEHPAMLEYSRTQFLRALCAAEPLGELPQAALWTEAKADWEAPNDRAAPRPMQKSPGWTYLKSGTAEGHLIGGCLESLQHLRGTPYWPDWSGAILFLETSEQCPSPATVDGILMDYENMGVLAQLRGLLVGRPMRYSENQKFQLREVLLERTLKYSFPIVSDMDFGHTAPQLTLPVGCRARIDTSRHVVEVVERCTQD